MLLALSRRGLGARVKLAIVRRRYAQFGGAERFIDTTMQAIAAASIDLSINSESWSGGACSLPDGMKLVILNPNHGAARTKATLMEEICHVFLAHEPTRLSVVTKDERGKVMNRDYRKTDEEEAYGVGAAALVPYAALKRLLLQGKTSREIGVHFRVSRELVEYRMKVTHLWREFKDVAIE